MGISKAILQHCWIGCCAVALLAQTRLLFGLPLAFGALEGTVFCGSLFAYNVVRNARLPRALAFASGLIGIVCFLAIPVAAQALVLFAACAWTLYYTAYAPVQPALRTVPLMKPFTIAFTWSLVTALLPLPPSMWSDAVFLVVGRAAFILALALAYDVCDEAQDRKFGLQTLVVRLGRINAFRVIDCALLVSAACVIANFLLDNYSAAAAVALFLSLAACAWLLRVVLREVEINATQKVMIDTMMLLQFLIVLIETSVTRGYPFFF
ncbi:MAG TPA: UbiA family prenyltransferase [Candidatus Hydrogenedentes bacterium]|nr:UbiA family prenyltransferase [Candidatus Hydrogenedentota bacterium]